MLQHHINIEKFLIVFDLGSNFAENKYLVTFGVVPTSPQTGYGYIKSDQPFNLSEIKGNKITAFTEKPTYKKACEFVKVIQKRQGLLICSPEQIAFRNCWINKKKLIQISKKYPNDYGKSLRLI